MRADHRVLVHPGDAGGIYPRTGAAGWVPVRRVLICDERPRAVQVLTELVTAIPSVVDIDGVRDGFGAVDAFAAHPAGVVLIGIQAGRNTGTDAANLLLGMHPAAAVIVYGTAGDIGPLTAAVIRGARGLMLWDPDSGHRPAPPHGPNAGSRWPVGDRGGELTARERQVLHGMAAGQSNRAIGRALFLSQDTVKTHSRGLFHKLGAATEPTPSPWEYAPACSPDHTTPARSHRCGWAGPPGDRSRSIRQGTPPEVVLGAV